MSTGNALVPNHDARLVELTGAHPVTVRRWKKLARLPRWLERLVRVCLQGELGEIDPAWNGWRIVRGELISPEGRSYSPGAIRASTLWRARALELGALDRKSRIAFDANPANFEHADRVAAVHRALTEARAALDEITDRLSTSERNRIFCSPGAPAPTPRPRIRRRVVGPEHGVGAGLLFEFIDARMGALGSAQGLVDFAVEGGNGDTTGEGSRDEREQDALADAHNCEAR
jgi:hypothetical protein